MYKYYICLLGGDSKILASCQALFHRFALDGEVQKESERSEAAKQRPSFRMVIGKSWGNHGKIYTIHILHEGVNGIGIHFPPMVIHQFGSYTYFPSMAMLPHGYPWKS